jgi:hypothetical protein
VRRVPATEIETLVVGAVRERRNLSQEIERDPAAYLTGRIHALRFYTGWTLSGNAGSLMLHLNRHV